ITDIPPVLGQPASQLIESLEQFRLGGDGAWTQTALALRDRYGPFILAYLETIVRVADWRASAGLEVVSVQPMPTRWTDGSTSATTRSGSPGQACPIALFAIRSTIPQAAPPSSHSATRPRTMTGVKGSSGGANDSATRGSRRRFRALRDPGPVKMAI